MAARNLFQFGSRKGESEPEPVAPPADTDAAETTPPKRRFVGILQVAIVLALIVVAFYVARAPSSDEVANRATAVGGPPGGVAGGPPGSGGAGAAPPPKVRLLTPTPTAAALTISATGTVQARNYVALTPLVSGRVISIADSLRTGGSFAAGETLLEIDPRDFELALAQRRADLAGAEATLKLTEAESDVAKTNYAILNPGKPVPPLVAKTPQIEQAAAQVAAARARLDVADLDFARARFSLPFDGRITMTSAEVGQLLTRGQSFGQAFADDAVEAVVPMSPDQFERIDPAVGRVARIRVGDETIPAVVERVSAEVDDRSRFTRLYLWFENHGRIPPGTFVDIEIEGPNLDNVFVLPESVEQVNGAVWVVNDSILERVQPTLHGRDDRGLIVEQFNTYDGIVDGAVPGGRPGLAVEPL